MRFDFSALQSSLRRTRVAIVVLLLMLFLAPLLVSAQNEPDPNAAVPQAAPAAIDPAAAPAAPTPVAATPAVATPPAIPTVWDLAWQGGIFMIPIIICSIVVVAYAIERFIALRSKNISPPGLLIALQKLNTENAGIDPRQAYEVCLQFPSPLARVIQAAVLKVGRPHAELEQAVVEAVGSEADDMAANLKPINTACVLGPQLGLIGTVQGMILAFMVLSSTSATGAAKGQELAQGIYTALVTTFAGLCVSIPAIMFTTILESRIERLLRGMEAVFSEMLPQFERFEGKMRVSRKPDASGVMLKNTGPKPATADNAARPATSRPAPDSVPAGAPAPKSLWGVMGTKDET